MKGAKKRAVFFDRDGVIFAPVFKDGSRLAGGEKGLVRAPFSYAEFLEAGGITRDALPTIRALRKKGFLTILVTNQPDVAYGNISRDEWGRIHAHAAALPFDDIYVCFHTRTDGCECKKPKPGMLFAAAKKWNIDLDASYFIGDTESDTLAAKAAGCASILVGAWYNKNTTSDHRIHDLTAAAAFIL